MIFFLSDRIYWIYWIFISFSQFPEETEKEESRYAGEMKPCCAFSMECHNTHLWFVNGAFCCRLWRHWVFVLPSPPASPERLAMAGSREGQKYNKNHVNPVNPV